MSTAFNNIPSETVAEIQRELGVVFEFGGNTISASVSVLILAATSVLFYGLAIVSLSRKQK